MSKDLFSRQSDLYAKYRPGYPPELIKYILRFVQARSKAWDCATGNGQAALLLANFFESVYATDISENQIKNAQHHPHITYSLANAESSSFPDQFFDLITVAQAYHWFNFAKFETEVRRVLKPGGIIAIWGYGLTNSQNPDVNQLLKSFYENTVGPYWDSERKYIDDRYRTVLFPYHQVSSSDFFFDRSWSLDDLCGYLNTWSSVQHFFKAQGFDPVEKLKVELLTVWPRESMINFQFPLFLRIGKV